MKISQNYVFFALCIVLMFGTISQIDAQQLQIPNWIRNNAKWWYQGQIQDSEFIKGIEYLVENKIMIIPIGSNEMTNQNKIIPSWVKNNAGWWANGTISDIDFVSGIQYMIRSGIILISSNMTIQDKSGEQCNKFTTDSEKETCIEQLEFDKKIKNLLKTVPPHPAGPVTFYYISSELHDTDSAKKLLTIHFIVENKDDHEITLSCQRPDSCNYELNDGQNKIPFSTNTLVYGSLTLTPHSHKYLDWTFYSSIDSLKNYTFLIKEPWGSGSIPIKIS